MKYYQIKPIYKDRTVFILGGGPSLPSSLDGLDLSNVPVIGVNNAFRFPNVDVLWFADSRFYWWYRKDVDKFKGLKLTYNRHPELMGSVEYIPGLNIVNGKPGAGISKTKIMFSASSGGSSINVAYKLGAKRVILLGFDMRYVGNESNWWDYSEFQEPRKIRRKPYDAFINPFNKIKKDAEVLGLEILNATPDSALDMFKFVEAHDYTK